MSEAGAKIRITADGSHVVSQANRMRGALAGAAGAAGGIGTNTERSLLTLGKALLVVRAIDSAFGAANKKADELAKINKDAFDAKKSIAVVTARMGLRGADQIGLQEAVAGSADEKAAISAVEQMPTVSKRLGVAGSIDYVKAAGSGLFQSDELERFKKYGVPSGELNRRRQNVGDEVRVVGDIEKSNRESDRQRASGGQSYALNLIQQAQIAKARRESKTPTLEAVTDFAIGEWTEANYRRNSIDISREQLRVLKQSQSQINYSGRINSDQR